MTAPKNFESVALEWLVQHLGYPRKGLETELAKLLQKVHDEAKATEDGESGAEPADNL